MRIDVRVAGHGGALPLRHGEPVTIGVPWPRGAVAAGDSFRLSQPDGRRVPVQTRVLDAWPDGSARWVLVDFQADTLAAAYYLLEPSSTRDDVLVGPSGGITVREAGASVVVETGAATLVIDRRGIPLAGADAAALPGAAESGLWIASATGERRRLEFASIEVEERGSIRTVVKAVGQVGAADPELAPLVCVVRAHVHAGSPVVRLAITLTNTRAAEHPGNFWELGDRGSVLLKELALVLAGQARDGGRVRVSLEPGTAPAEAALPLSIYQASSGGPNWSSANHVARDGRVRLPFQGYRVRSGGEESHGLRATPIATMGDGARAVSVALPGFWQNFPKSLAISGDRLTVGLFPRESPDLHELQGGEQKTHELFLAFGADPVSAPPLDRCRAMLVAVPDPRWCCETGVVPHLSGREHAASAPLDALIDLALDPVEGVAAKRERIDEYGWRHFGDLYADHEAVFHQGETPLVSHYNNQYDVVAGLALQFLRSGDARWRTLMHDLARHVVDIDLYHTTGDRAAYSGGLFWHTWHYCDAGRATHRGYPRAAGVPGGGPSNEHNYNAGLMLDYFLTGDPHSREAAIGLAQWVLDVDDGGKSNLARLDRGDTGLASVTAQADYHGPGRGAGNSIAALMAGHRLTGERRFLAKAEALIRRCIHPDDDVDGRRLLDAERRWSYTVFLQALGRYLDVKLELGERDAMYAYARASLLRYAEWMAQHEYPYLERPDILEYPTETWAAQDIRKADVLAYAYLHAGGTDRGRFLECARVFFDSSTSTLAGMATRALARPLAILLANGFLTPSLERHPGASLPAPDDSTPFPPPIRFVSQKTRAKHRLILLAALGSALLAAFVGLWLFAA